MAAEDEIRRLILEGQLLPGQKVRQADLAQRLGLSRIPVREALVSLEAEGLVEHLPNSGYTVVIPTAEALSEVYLMRRLLETALLRSVTLPEVDVERMQTCNARLADLDPGASFDYYRALNRDFHDTLFDASPLRLVRKEVARVWTLSEFYRSLYIHEPGADRQVLHDHAEMIAAIRAGDLDTLVAVSDRHRDTTERSMSRVLGARGRSVQAGGSD